MYLKNLQHINLKILADTFNLAFSDYVIPMHFTEAQLIQKLTRDGINLEYSVGAFEGEALVGFILQGVGQWEGQLTAYNGGTGVIPAYRGRNLTRQLYAYSLPQLRAAGVKNCLLEVVTHNQKALNIYEKIGFGKGRTLISYKGELPASTPGYQPEVNVNNVMYREVSDLEWNLVESFWEYRPSWGYNFAALQRTRAFTRLAGVYRKEQLIGYAALHENTNRIAQFAIAPAYRRQGLGLHLFRKLAGVKPAPLSVINVDESSEATLNFLEDIGFKPFLTQYEMILNL